MNSTPPKHFKGTLTDWHRICYWESFRKSAELAKQHKPNITSRRTSKTAWKSHDIIPNAKSSRDLIAQQNVKWKGWKRDESQKT